MNAAAQAAAAARAAGRAKCIRRHWCCGSIPLHARVFQGLISLIVFVQLASLLLDYVVTTTYRCDANEAFGVVIEELHGAMVGAVVRPVCRPRLVRDADPVPREPQLSHAQRVGFAAVSVATYVIGTMMTAWSAKRAAAAKLDAC